jgi:hypothetical protein
MDTITRAKWEVRRVELKKQYDEAEAALRTTQHQLKNTEREYQEWVTNFAQWEHQAKQLQRELASATDQQFDMVISGTGEAPRRNREAIENELLEVAKMLAAFSNDAGLMREYQELEKRIADTKPYIVLKNSYVRLADGEIVTEQEFQERAIKLGSDVVSRGATSSGYCPGARVLREEAARLGLS